MRIILDYVGVGAARGGRERGTRGVGEYLIFNNSKAFSIGRFDRKENHGSET